MTESEAQQAADQARAVCARIASVARGRLVALLASRDRDISSAEDHLAEAFARALEVWPDVGIPANPEGWLLTVARNLARDRHKSAAVRLIEPEGPETEAVADQSIDPDDIPDERLKLMFACAHPAVDRAIHTPLMLQTVLGLDVAQIALVFLMPASALAQRLVRAKQKIKLARVSFSLPGQADMPERLEAVLDAIYGLYTVTTATGFQGVGSERVQGLQQEALYLANLLADLIDKVAPTEAEALGLAALLAHLEARAPARRGEGGRYVPLAEQDVCLWDQRLLLHAEMSLHAAQERGAVGRFQLEAAIQSVHAARRLTGQIDWAAIAMLHEALLRLAPSIGAATGLAAAVAEAQGPAAGLACLDAYAPQIGDAYQPAWATRAAILTKLGRHDEASAAYAKAIELADDPAVRAFLEGQMSRAWN